MTNLASASLSGTVPAALVTVTLMTVTTVIALTASMMIAPGIGHAEDAPEERSATELFDDARALMKRDDFAAACPLLEASLKLDPALGTHINLAYCYQQVGKLASAWRHYRESEKLAQRERDKAFARDRARLLKPHVPRLLFRVLGATDTPGLEVAYDGIPVTAAGFGELIHVDPGSYTVTAIAPGRVPFSTTIEAEESRVVIVELPELQRIPAPAEPSTPASGIPMSTNEPRPPDRSGQSTGQWRRTLGYATGGVGIATIAAGVGLGWSASKHWDDAFDSGLCEPEPRRCTPAGIEQTDEARRRGDIADIMLGTGAALTALGVVLYLTTPRRASERPRTHTRVTPYADGERFGVALIGGF